MHNSLFIIIVTYNGMTWLKKCLDSCANYPVIVVDNASADETVSYIRTNFPEIKLLEQTKNLGFGQANNLGIRHALDAGANYVFLLNQDAYLHEGCIEALIATHKQHADFGIFSPIHLNGKGNRLDKNFSNYMGYINNPDFFSDFVLKRPLQEIYEVPFVNAAGWLLSLRILETVGGFDPIFFHYGEDVNYCQRAIYHKFKIGVVPNAFIRHDRETRKVLIASGESIQHLNKIERTLKLKFGDINQDKIEYLDELKKKKIWRKRFNYLIGKWSEAVFLKKEIKLITDTKKELLISRVQNLKVGRNHLGIL